MQRQQTACHWLARESWHWMNQEHEFLTRIKPMKETNSVVSGSRLLPRVWHTSISIAVIPSPPFPKSWFWSSRRCVLKLYVQMKGINFLGFPYLDDWVRINTSPPLLCCVCATYKRRHGTFGAPCYDDPTHSEVVLNWNGKRLKLNRVEQSQAH